MVSAQITPMVSSEICSQKHKNWNRVLTALVAIIVTSCGLVTCGVFVANTAEESAVGAGKVAEAVRGELKEHAAGERERDKAISATLDRLDRRQEEIYKILSKR